MRLNRLLPALLLLPLMGGCSYDAMPDWLVEMLGGPKRTGRYVDGPLKEHYAVVRAGLKLPLPVQDGALRMEITPSRGRYEYLLDLTPYPANCLMWWKDRELADKDIEKSCELIAVRVWRTALGEEGAKSRVESHLFYVPEGDYRDALEAFNARLKGWRGHRSLMLDGTGVGLEQMYRSRLGSMTANAGASPAANPLSQLTRDMQRLMLAYGPANFFPRNAGWYSFTDPAHPCRSGLAGTDPDGMGTGDDACAASLKARPR